MTYLTDNGGSRNIRLGAKLVLEEFRGLRCLDTFLRTQGKLINNPTCTCILWSKCCFLKLSVHTNWQQGSHIYIKIFIYLKTEKRTKRHVNIQWIFGGFWGGLILLLGADFPSSPPLEPPLQDRVGKPLLRLWLCVSCGTLYSIQ